MLIRPDARLASTVNTDVLSFSYDTVSDGKIDEKIEVSQHGYYTLTIENTSDFDVTINGYVNY